ncbi:MAG: DNA methyltransferase [Acidimicrobiia bacterium]
MPDAVTADIAKHTVRERATSFASRWQDAVQESAEKQTFWNEFFAIFGIDRRLVGKFELLAERASTGNVGWIDLLYPGHMAVEHKSAGQSLDQAMDQVIDYLPTLHQSESPWLLVVCDFRKFRWRNLVDGTQGSFALRDLADHVHLFWWMAGHAAPNEAFANDEDVNLAATQLMANIHDALADSGYEEAPTREWLTRVLFCLFADDTGVWERALFHSFVVHQTRVDGSDLGSRLAEIFQVLDTPEEERSPNLDEDLSGFTYINGDIFETRLPIPSCTEEIRNALLDACRFNWAAISPAIFGSMFQNVMTAAERRQLGAHYTSEENILRTIRPLFLDDFEQELEQARSRPKLQAFLDRIASLRILDPACGCGNFLVVSYRELRRLETEALRRLQTAGRSGRREVGGQLTSDLDLLCRVAVDQFYGIEIEEFPARIARTALYLMDHMANRAVSAEFGQHYVRFPIPSSPQIKIGNALRLDWASVVAPSDVSYVIGNPPFGGRQYRTAEQQEDMRIAFDNAPGHGVLDYVAAWLSKAATYISGTSARCAFVATNSISQGQNVGALWPRLLEAGVKIDFAHRPFAWTSEASGRAAVHVVIVGFSMGVVDTERRIFDYAHYRGDPVELSAEQISPYLIDGEPVLVAQSRSLLTDSVPSAKYGSMANDGGHLLFDETNVGAALSDPVAARFLRPYLGGKELLHGHKRWALWLESATPGELRGSRLIRERVEAVKQYRQASSRAATREAAATPHLFTEPRDVGASFLLVPYVSSELRPIVPMAICGPKALVRAPSWCVPDADSWLFGVMQSSMFMAWLRTVSGRLESRLQLSPGTVYNPFPWPERSPDGGIEEAAEAVVARRRQYPDASLAAMYDHLAMPRDLVQAHAALDRAVERSYVGRRRLGSDAERVSHLLGLYNDMVGGT